MTASATNNGHDRKAQVTAASTTNNEPDRKPARVATAPAPESKPAQSAKGEATAWSWLRSLFTKLAQLVRDVARAVSEFTKREPLAVAAAAAIALLLIVKP